MDPSIERHLVAAAVFVGEAVDRSHLDGIDHLSALDNEVVRDELDGAIHHLVNALCGLPSWKDLTDKQQRWKLMKLVTRRLKKVELPDCLGCIFSDGLGHMLEACRLLAERTHREILDEINRAFAHVERAALVIEPDSFRARAPRADNPDERRWLDARLEWLEAGVEGSRKAVRSRLANAPTR